MVAYGRKLTNFEPISLNLKKPEPPEIDHYDIKNRNDNDVSEFGQMVAYKQGLIRKEVEAVTDYLNNTFKKLK
jgi:hypothetical protein